MPSAIDLTARLLSAFVLIGTATSSGLSSRSSYTLKERHHVPSNWARVARASADYEIELHIGLRQARFDELDQLLFEVSSPLHVRYGKHLSAEEVQKLIAPHDKSLDLVVEWLLENGIKEDMLSFSQSRDWISTTLPITKVESLLSTEYHLFQDEDTFVVRTSEVRLPAHLHEHVDCVQPTTSFFGSSSASKKRNLNYNKLQYVGNSEMLPRSEAALRLSAHQLDVQNACNASDVTPLCLQTLYGTKDYKIQSSATNSMALTNYLGQFNNRSDISLFLSHYRPDIPKNGWDFTFLSIAGGLNPQTPATAWQLDHGKGKEGNLDAQVMLGLAYPTPLTVYSTLGTPPPFKPTAFAPNNTNEPYLIWLNYMLALPDSQLPKVISTSYGDIEHTLPPAYARRVCNSFAQLGARGVSLIFGSGDSGVGTNGTCHTNHNDGTTEIPKFLTSFPDCCPYVTSVGGTMGLDPERVAEHEAKKFISGGGFSHYFPRPRWQDNAVKKYVSLLGGLHKGMYNPEGAAYPDVSAQGYQYAIIWNGTKHLVDGTSASAPTFAAIIALANDALMAEGKPVLGFLNPWIWGMEGKGGGFVDVTLGNIRGCNGSGFPAASGWDAASGWGTPWFPALKEIALSERFRSQKAWYLNW